MLTQKEGGLGWASGATAASQNEDHVTSRGEGAKVFFSNSGTEANEGALKIARMAGKHRWSAKTGQTWNAPGVLCDKYRIACFESGFHGRSMGALSVTTNSKYQAPFTPLLPGVDVGRLNDEAGLETLVTDATCAVIVEPIQGEGGVNVSQLEWLRKLRQRCDETGAVLIFDEIQVSIQTSCTRSRC
jgi:acetylornithine aminotransferase